MEFVHQSEKNGVTIFLCYMRRVWYQWQIICRQNSTIWMHWMGIHGAASHLPRRRTFLFWFLGCVFPELMAPNYSQHLLKWLQHSFGVFMHPLYKILYEYKKRLQTFYNLIYPVVCTQKVLICKLPWKMATRHLHFSSALFISFSIWGAAELC